ncbi:major facilitator superfamily protein [Sarocladium implicatum]|nr:major facilitator superfamily protein [Sarocladium implicatum]
MATNEKAGAEVPPTSNPGVNNALNNDSKDAKGSDTASVLKEELAVVEQGYLATEGRLPSPEEQIEALGIPNWRELEKKIVRRLDMTLMPCVWCLYFFNYLDRASIGQARLSTLEEDLNLVGSNFSSAVSILSLGYVLGQLPSNMLITKMRPSLYLCLMAIVWSGVSASTVGVSSYSGLMGVRFALGLVEAPLLPGAIYLCGCWYTRKEIAMRMAILYSAQTIAFCSAGLIAAATYATLEQAHGLAGWQWLFIILAVAGAGSAMICLWIIPDYPTSTTGSAMWSMTEDMRKIAAARVIADRPSTSEAKPGAWEGLKMAVRDPKLYILTLMNITISAAYGFSNFYPSIVRGLAASWGYSSVIALILTAPPYLFAAIGSYVNAWHSDKVKERGLHYAIPVAVACIGFIVCLATENAQARYGASFVYVGGMYIANPLIMGYVSGALGKTPEKRAVSVALCNLISQIGNFTAPFMFVSSEEPRYISAFIGMMAFGLSSSACAIVMKIWLTRSNKRLLREAQQNGTVYQPYVT